jgi:hypothetical protein
MSRTPRPMARLARLLVVAAIGTAVTTGVVASAATAAPPYTSDERALAIASPSLVYLETVYMGYLRNKATNVPLLADPVVYNRRCSGFVVNPDGVVATTRVCVQPPEETIRQQSLYVAGNMLVGQKKLDASQLAAWVNSNIGTTVYSGMSENSAVSAQLFGQLNVATGALIDKPAISGRILGAADQDQGNVAIVKLNQSNLPAVQLAPNTNLDVGASVLTVGFNTADADDRVGTYTPLSKSVQVAGQGTRGKAPLYKINDKLGTYEHGGMALDSDGRVTGMIDEDPNLPNNQNRAVAKASTVSALLAKLNVFNTLGPNDQVYRSGLDAYFKGRYSQAINQLGETTKNVPTNHVARTYQLLAANRQRVEGEPSTLPGWVLPAASGGGAALVAGILGVLIGRRLSRRRRAIDRTPEPAATPPGRYQPEPFAGPQSPWYPSPSPPPVSSPPVASPPPPPPLMEQPAPLWSSPPPPEPVPQPPQHARQWSMAPPPPSPWSGEPTTPPAQGPVPPGPTPPGPTPPGPTPPGPTPPGPTPPGPTPPGPTPPPSPWGSPPPQPVQPTWPPAPQISPDPPPDWPEPAPDPAPDGSPRPS